MNTVSKSLLGMALAAGAVYFLDPVSGRRRRVLLRDQCSRAARAVDLRTRDARHGISDRMQGIASTAKTRFSPPSSDRTIGRHVHRSLRHAVSHPKSLGVSVRNGNIFLRGDIYSHEHQRLLDQLRAIPGVRVVTDHLNLREAAEGIRPLANGAGKGDGWSTVGRLFVGAGSCALVLWGVRERKAIGELGSSLGHAIRDFTHKELGWNLDEVGHVVDKGIDAVEDAGREALDSTQRMWQGGERPSGGDGHTRVAV